eukprot:g16258.t1
MAHINFSLPACLDAMQFAYRRNRSTVDAISLDLYLSREHLDSKDTYIRLLLIDYSSIPYNWILTFLTPQTTVKIDNSTSSTIILNTSTPQRCVLSPLLYSLYAHGYVAKFHTKVVYKFADDTTV